MIEQYYKIYEQWLEALHKIPNEQIEFRVTRTHTKIKEARLEEFPMTIQKFSEALYYYEDKQYQECYASLGLLYGSVLADISERHAPSLSHNYVVGNKVMVVTQDLSTSRVINIQLRT